MKTSELPMPRLQIRWEGGSDQSDFADSHREWTAFYELILPLDNWDIRNEEKKGFIAIPIGETKVSSAKKPLNGDGAVDTPFRDGVHIMRDQLHLKIPGYAVYGDVATLIESKLPRT